MDVDFEDKTMLNTWDLLTVFKDINRQRQTRNELKYIKKGKMWETKSIIWVKSIHMNMCNYENIERRTIKGTNITRITRKYAWIKEKLNVKEAEI